MRRTKSDWLLIAVGGLLGAFFGFAAVYFALWSPGALIEVSLVDAVVRNASPQPGEEARLDVDVLGHWHYSRTSANPDELLAELDALTWIDRLPGIVVIGLAFAVGVQVGARAGRWANRRRTARSIS